MKEKSK
jgi:hypothetical protein